MIIVLDWISGICWSLVYLIATFKGVHQKAYFIPALCICLNYSWEMWIILVRSFLHFPIDMGFIIQIIWAILDIGVVYTWIRYNKNTLCKKLCWFIVVMLVMSVFTMITGLWNLVAFGINLIMSITFVLRLDKQVHLSYIIAVLKCIGTLAATVLNGILIRNYGILLLGMLCLLADIYYIIDLKLTWKLEVKT